MRIVRVTLLLLLAGCASQPDDSDVVRRTVQVRSRESEIARLLVQADALRQTGQFEGATQLYRRVHDLEPVNARAAAGLAALEAQRRHQAVLAEAEELMKQEKYPEAADKLRLVLAENPSDRAASRLQRLVQDKGAPSLLAPPRLKPASAGPISLEARDLPVRAVFDIIGRQAGVDFVFDRDVRADLRASIAVRNVQLEELIRLVLSANQLDQKLINESTVLVYPNTPQKQREHQELMLKVFYVTNADARLTGNMLRQMLRMRDVFVDEKLGMVVVRDTPTMVRLAERLIAAQDLAEAEVMLEVEVLEVARNRLLELGLKFPDTLGVGLGGAAGPGTLTLGEWRAGGSDLVRLTFSDPLFLLLLRQQDGASNILANPRIRVKNREKARIHIGDRVPVITTTAATSGGFVSETVTYLDVGLKLEVEPLVHFEEEVAIKVGLEVSNIAREVRGSNSNTLAYQIGTRNAATTLRLKDGETQILAGLISDEDRRTASRVPGLGDLPILGRLFSQTSDTRNKTEIVLLITPRVLRTPVRPEARAAEFAAGTDAAIGTGGSGAPPVGAPAQPPQPAQPSPAAQPPPGTSVSPFSPGSPLNPPGMLPFGGPQPMR